MPEHRSLAHLSRGVAVALLVGLTVAALPVLVTRARPCAAPAPPHPDAPAYLVLASDPRIEEVRCEADGRLALVTVRSPVEASARLLEESVAGIILDRESYERLRAGQIGEWLTTGAGRAVVAFDLTAAQLRADVGGAPPPDPALPSSYLGDSYYGHLTFASTPGRGSCGGAGTTPYRGPPAARALIDRLLEWAARDCGSA